MAHYDTLGAATCWRGKAEWQKTTTGEGYFRGYHSIGRLSGVFVAIGPIGTCAITILQKFPAAGLILQFLLR